MMHLHDARRWQRALLGNSHAEAGVCELIRSPTRCAGSPPAHLVPIVMACERIGVQSLVLRNELERWVDSGPTRTGANWQQEITAGIRGCALFILIASAAHFSTYVATEIGTALSLQKFILPFYIGSPRALVPFQPGH